jgi:hypothetical protein
VPQVGADARHPARDVVLLRREAGVHVVGQIPASQVEAEVADEPRFRTEHKAAYAGMQPVSSDNKVHGAGRRPREVDVNQSSVWARLVMASPNRYSARPAPCS